MNDSHELSCSVVGPFRLVFGMQKQAKPAFLCACWALPKPEAHGESQYNSPYKTAPKWDICMSHAKHRSSRNRTGSYLLHRALFPFSIYLPSKCSGDNLFADKFR